LMISRRSKEITLQNLATRLECLRHCMAVVENHQIGNQVIVLDYLQLTLTQRGTGGLLIFC